VLFIFRYVIIQHRWIIANKYFVHRLRRQYSKSTSILTLCLDDMSGTETSYNSDPTLTPHTHKHTHDA